MGIRIFVFFYMFFIDICLLYVYSLNKSDTICNSFDHCGLFMFDSIFFNNIVFIVTIAHKQGTTCVTLCDYTRPSLAFITITYHPNVKVHQ